MHELHAALRSVHIAIGALALILFWLPAFARKGSPRHIRFGQWYAGAMYAVAASAIVLSLLVLLDPLAVRYPDGIPADRDPARLAQSARVGGWFLAMLGLLVLASVHHGRRVLHARGDRSSLRRPAHLALLASVGLTGIWVLIVGIRSESTLLLVFSLLAMSGSFGMLRYAFKTELTRREWWLEHMGNLIGSGIGAYTAFFAFGGSRFLAEWLPGQWQLIPWITPAIIGTLATRILRKRYEQRFATAASHPS